MKNIKTPIETYDLTSVEDDSYEIILKDLKNCSLSEKKAFFKTKLPKTLNKIKNLDQSFLIEELKKDLKSTDKTKTAERKNLGGITIGEISALDALDDVERGSDGKSTSDRSNLIDALLEYKKDFAEEEELVYEEVKKNEEFVLINAKEIKTETNTKIPPNSDLAAKDSKPLSTEKKNTTDTCTIS